MISDGMMTDPFKYLQGLAIKEECTAACYMGLHPHIETTFRRFELLS